ncbi:MAG: hypothetical protein DRJ28_03005 [Actinobacteria bacterium]|nr:MAG: hypothetical protein DRJ28_03005 [Actinomycetota bacterium]
MLEKVLPLVLVAVVAAACSSAPVEPDGHENPERAVVAWFEAIDNDDAEGASSATHAETLALILGIENDLDAAAIAAYLDDGVPMETQASYWASFAAGFVEFASRPISTLTVGESERFTSEGVEFASVPISGGPGSGSVVIARMRADGLWEVDLVASLGDGFAQLLASEYDDLPNTSEGDRVRLAYSETVVPSLWAAMADGSFGDDFTRTALAIIGKADG